MEVPAIIPKLQLLQARQPIRLITFIDTVVATVLVDEAIAIAHATSSVAAVAREAVRDVAAVREAAAKDLAGAIPSLAVCAVTTVEAADLASTTAGVKVELPRFVRFNLQCYSTKVTLPLGALGGG
jgi:hypothetical protein